VTDQILGGQADSWEPLFQPHCFFVKYKHYLMITVSAASADDLLDYRGLVESKVRHLVTSLDRNSNINLVHISPDTLGPPPDAAPDSHVCIWALGLVFNKSEHLNVDLTLEIQTFTEHVHKQAYSTANKGSLKEGNKLDVKYVKRKQLPQYLPATTILQMRKSLSSGTLPTAQNGAGSPAALPQHKKRPSESGPAGVPDKKSRTSSTSDTTADSPVLAANEDSNSSLTTVQTGPAPTVAVPPAGLDSPLTKQLARVPMESS